MIQKAICKGCQSLFQYEFIKKSRKFCTTECEMNYFNHLNHPPATFPKYRCEKCEKDIQLDFYPNKNLAKWEEFLRNHKC